MREHETYLGAYVHLFFSSISVHKRTMSNRNNGRTILVFELEVHTILFLAFKQLQIIQYLFTGEYSEGLIWSYLQNQDKNSAHIKYTKKKT